MPIISDLILKSKIDSREAELLMAFALKQDRPYVLAHKPDMIDDKPARRFLSLAGRRQKNEPIAYLIGSQPFCGRDFLVDRHTLIPRPETEVLADLVLRHIRCGASRTQSTLRTLGDAKDVIVDVGTGSGCLATTLALACPSATVIASDVSDEALKVARRNARQLGAKVKFIKDDLLGPKLKSNVECRMSNMASEKNSAQRTCDIQRSGHSLSDIIFVANLPYLPSTDKKTMMPDVVRFEPSKALFAGQDGTSLIVKLMKQIRTLNVECSIFLELDPRQTKKLMALAHQLFPGHKVKIEKDLCGRERFLTLIPAAN